MNTKEVFLKQLIRLMPASIRTSLFYRFRLHKSKNIVFRTVSKLSFCKNVVFKGIESDIIFRNIFFTGFYEYPLTKIIFSLAQKGGIMVDAGANQAYHSLLFCAAGRGNKVYAFEPSLRNINIINDNIQLNSACIQDRLQLFPLGLGDKSETLTFDPGDEEQTGWGKIVSGKESPLFTSIHVRRLDEILPEAAITLLKIDVEGYDLKVILGAEKLITKGYIQNLIFEYEGDFSAHSDDIQARDVFQLLTENNYLLKKITVKNYLATHKTILT